MVFWRMTVKYSEVNPDNPRYSTSLLGKVGSGIISSCKQQWSSLLAWLGISLKELLPKQVAKRCSKQRWFSGIVGFFGLTLVIVAVSLHRYGQGLQSKTRTSSFLGLDSEQDRGMSGTAWHGILLVFGSFWDQLVIRISNSFLVAHSYNISFSCILSQTDAISRQGTAKLLPARHVLCPAKNAASHWENSGIEPWTLPREMPRRCWIKPKSVLEKGWLHHLCQELMAASILHFGQMADAYFLERILSWKLHQWSSFAAFPLNRFFCTSWEVQVTLKRSGLTDVIRQGTRWQWQGPSTALWLLKKLRL